ncbi:ribonuclease P protein component [Immundisolibacter sp.]|uniref:ribonuclease P protein component n=1 Tax=Immundisolibacter sp. TaxID=1934948 RepID=UPI003569F545
MPEPAVSGQRFTRQQRLLTAGQFKNIFRRGRRLRLDSLELITLSNDFGQPRLGVVVPKRCVKLAVRRNTIKRWARESFRRRQQRLPVGDIILQVRGQVVTFAQVEAAMERLCGAAP